MGRKTIQEECQVCGAQARRINYVSRAKGKTYHYLKYIHNNGVVHYFRQTNPSSTQSSTPGGNGKSVLDTLEELINSEKQKKGLKFKELKSLLENEVGKTVSVATVYRNLGKLIKLDLIEKQDQGGSIVYRRKQELRSSQRIRVTRMSIGFNLLDENVKSTVFIHVKNLGLQLLAGIPLSIPVGIIDSLDTIGMVAFDSTGEIPLRNDNIAYTYPEQTGITIPSKKPLRKLDEEDFFISYTFKLGSTAIKLSVLSEIDNLTVSCLVQEGRAIDIKKRLVDGLKEIEPSAVRRSRTETGRTIIEADFIEAIKGDTIVITLNNQS